MKITKDLKEMPLSELGARKDEFKKELLKLNVQVATGANTANPGRLRQVKKNLARILTIMKEKEGLQK